MNAQNALNSANNAAVSEANALAYKNSAQQIASGNMPLEAMSDVTIGTAKAGDLLAYDSASGQWVNKQDASLAMAVALG